MRAKTAAGLDGIIIDDAQCTELDVFGIMIIRERKTVPGIQPAVIGMAPLPGGRSSIMVILLSNEVEMAFGNGDWKWKWRLHSSSSCVGSQGAIRGGRRGTADIV